MFKKIRILIKNSKKNVLKEIGVKMSLKIIFKAQAIVLLLNAIGGLF